MKKRSRQNKKQIALPEHFVPQFWEDSDGRVAIVRMIRERLDTLKADCGANSFQKVLLCQRAVFISIQLETMEVNATQTGNIETGVYTQMVNSLVGLLKSLGLERKAKHVESLQSYVQTKKRRTA